MGGGVSSGGSIAINADVPDGTDEVLASINICVGIAIGFRELLDSSGEGG